MVRTEILMVMVAVLLLLNFLLVLVLVLICIKDAAATDIMEVLFVFMKVVVL